MVQLRSPRGNLGSADKDAPFKARMKRLDLHSVPDKEFLVHTYYGAILSTIFAISTAILIHSEYVYNLSPSLRETVHVNPTFETDPKYLATGGHNAWLGRSQQPSGRKLLEVEFDITLEQVPCSLLSVDAQDPMGETQSLHIDRATHRVFKHRLSKDGVQLGKDSVLETGLTYVHEHHLEADLGRKHNPDGAKGRGMNHKKHPNNGAPHAGHIGNGAKRNRPHDGDDIDDMYDLDDDTDDDADDFFDSDGHEDGRGDKLADKAALKSIRHKLKGDSCGSCHGAGEVGECCQTCEDVKRAYIAKNWHFDGTMDIKQCMDENVVEGKDEGCRVHGFVGLDPGGGNLHLAPGRDLENFGDPSDMRKAKPEDKKPKTADVSIFDQLTSMLLHAFETFNVTHSVNKFRFGTTFPGGINQLDTERRVIGERHSMHQYYVKVVPTTYTFLNGTSIHTNQYSVTEHTRHVSPGSSKGLPGIFFFYEVSPMHVSIEESRRGYIHFLTAVCAVVGGVFSLLRAFDGFIFHSGSVGKRSASNGPQSSKFSPTGTLMK